MTNITASAFDIGSETAAATNGGRSRNREIVAVGKRGLAYAVVIGAGLMIGAIVGVIAAAMLGLITIAC